jgi:hypothetical protein
MQLLGRQLAASVALVKALGGGWHASELTGSVSDNNASHRINTSSNLDGNTVPAQSLPRAAAAQNGS